MEFKKCKICDKKFYGFHTSKYCSKDCRNIAHFKSDKKWRQKQIKVRRVCINCNKILLKNRKKFCSFDCNIKYNSNYQKKLKNIKNYKRCKICNNFFKSKGNNNIYCKALYCQEEVLKQIRKREKTKRKYNRKEFLNKQFDKCKMCGKKFNKHRKNIKYCSYVCRSRADKISNYNGRKKAYYKNPEYKLQVLLRTRFKRALKNNSKSKSALKLIGCTIKQLKQHLENQFKEGMTWKNYNIFTWHIDHIIPCCKFDLSKEEEQKKCFHYTNLQPLWAKENLRKSGKVIVNESI